MFSQSEDLQPDVTANESDAPQAPAEEVRLSQFVSYEDFAKLEIKIGTIQSVEVIDGADKLLRLLVDVGEEAPRQIVSGIRTYFEDISWLEGKQCPFITNLEPRVIRGLESQGMILAASANDQLALLIPHVELPAGTSVS